MDRTYHHFRGGYPIHIHNPYAIESLNPAMVLRNPNEDLHLCELGQRTGETSTCPHNQSPPEAGETHVTRKLEAASMREAGIQVPRETTTVVYLPVVEVPQPGQIVVYQSHHDQKQVAQNSLQENWTSVSYKKRLRTTLRDPRWLLNASGLRAGHDIAICENGLGLGPPRGKSSFMEQGSLCMGPQVPCDTGWEPSNSHPYALLQFLRAKEDL